MHACNVFVHVLSDRLLGRTPNPVVSADEVPTFGACWDLSHLGLTADQMTSLDRVLCCLAIEFRGT